MIPPTFFNIQDNFGNITCPNTYDESDDQEWKHLAFWHGSNRPCDTCLGTQLKVHQYEKEVYYGPGFCPDCQGSGRHVLEQTFEGNRTFFIHILYVLPVVAFDYAFKNPSYVIVDPTPAIVYDNLTFPINLPQETHVGDYLVRFRIVS